MASRILGMGDILSVIDKVQKQFDLKQTKELEEKIRKQSFTLDDFLSQMQQVRNMGPLQDLLSMMPGVNSKMLKDVNIDEKELDKIEAMILSMTKKERENPDIIDNSRKQRIVKGSGTSITNLNKLLKQFKDSKKMMKKMQDMTKGAKKKGKFGLPFFNYKEDNMAVKIRLKRMGSKKKPFYRIVVADSRAPRDGKFIEEIGYYNPLTESKEIKVDAEKVNAWIKNGAKPTDTVNRLFKNNNIYSENK